MEIDPLEEYRALLGQQNGATTVQRYRWNCLKLPSLGALWFGIMICLLLLIVSLFAMEVYSSNSDVVANCPDFTEENDDDMFNVNGTDEKEHFLGEWKRGEKLLRERRQQLLNLYNEVLITKGTTPHKGMDLYFSSDDVEPIKKMSECALISEYMKKIFKKCISVDDLPEECLSLLRNTMECDSKYPYRNINGSCNNLLNPTWGISGSPYLRLLKPHYDDDVSSLRKSVYGVDLPNSRLLSSRIYNRKLLPDAETTMLFMNFGLFVDHDLVRSYIPSKEIVLQCCDPAVRADPRLRHPSCGEVFVPSTDPFFIKRNVTCLNFYRSFPTIGKCPGRREQTNIMTSYLDMSDTYGPSDEESEQLRTFEGGKLKNSFIDDVAVLPISNTTGNLCYTRDVQYKCFMSGDIRVNMHVEIMVLHTIWLREHNRLAENLQKLNPHWSDEKIFQEARRINIAEYQHITYNEYLSSIFGKKRMKAYGLEINPNEEYDSYDEAVESGVYNSFSSAAFRFGMHKYRASGNLEGLTIK